MEKARVEEVIARFSKAMIDEIDAWNRVEKYSKKIAELPYLQIPVDIHGKVNNFKFEQKFDREKALEAQRWLSQQIID